MLGDELDGRLCGQEIALLPGHTRPRVCVGEDAAEVRITALRLAEQRDVRVAFKRHFGTGDRAHADVLRARANRQA